MTTFSFTVTHARDAEFSRGLQAFFEDGDLGTEQATGGQFVAHVICAIPGELLAASRTCIALISSLSTCLKNGAKLSTRVQAWSKTRALLLTLFLAAPLSAAAYDSECARDNLAHEAAECSAYFMLVSALPGIDEATSKKSREVFGDLLELAVNLSNAKVTEARFELAKKGMFLELDGKGSNIAIVSNKYGYPCANLAKNPEARLKYWLEMKD